MRKPGVAFTLSQAISNPAEHRGAATLERRRPGARRHGGHTVPRVHFQVETDLSPDAVLTTLTDFGSDRAEAWGNIAAGHSAVHEQGPGSAEVTEGNWLAWERSRYLWSDSAAPLIVTTVESNTWKPGSSWEYRFSATGRGGTRVDVTVIRRGHGLRGALLAPVIALLGSRLLRSDMRKVLARASRNRAG
jgi:hypothetical protein